MKSIISISNGKKLKNTLYTDFLITNDTMNFILRTRKNKILNAKPPNKRGISSKILHTVTISKLVRANYGYRFLAV